VKRNAGQVDVLKSVVMTISVPCKICTQVY